MDIFIVISFLGGLALFLYGMRTMGKGLESLSGGSMKRLVARLCSTTWRGVLVGAAVTAAIQSSSATTVMVIGFVNSGLMELGHAVGVIMGANLGTTVTSWLLSLTGIGGDSVILRLLKPDSLAALLALAGVILLMSRGAGKEKRGRVGAILSGLGILFFGMEMMSGALEPLSALPGFTRLLTLFSNPIAGLAAGALMTAIVQSSSAAIGILQAMALSGGVTFSAAMPIVMGQNIGTCVTTLISGIGASKNARRAAFVHLYFNAIGAAVFMAVLYGINAVRRFEFFDAAVTPVAIATIHTVFNVFSLIILYPFAGGLRRLAELTVPGESRAASRREADAYQLLDERFLRVPSTALEICRQAFFRMLWLARRNFSLAVGLLEHYDGAAAEQVGANEQLIDAYEDDLGSYMIRLSTTAPGEREMSELTKLMYAIGDVERIGDHAESLAKAAGRLEKVGEGGLSKEAGFEFGRLSAALEELLELTGAAVADVGVTAFDVEASEKSTLGASADSAQNKAGAMELNAQSDTWAAGDSAQNKPDMSADSAKNKPDMSAADSPQSAATRVEPLCEVIASLCEELREHHIQRLQLGVCSANAAAVYDAMLIDAQRISAHCSNIAVSVIQRYDDRLTAHKYVRAMREHDADFERVVSEYARRLGLLRVTDQKNY